MAKKYLLVPVDPLTVPRRELFRVLGVPFTATERAWIGPLWFLPLGWVAAFALQPGRGLGWIGWGVVYALLCEVVYMIHSIGHVLGGKRVGAPMDENLLTSTRQVNIYRGDQSKYPRRVHVSRALGGPLANIAVGVVAGLALLTISDLSVGAYTLAVFCVGHLIFGFGSLAPIPSVDGAVIWRELLRTDRL